MFILHGAPVRYKAGNANPAGFALEAATSVRSSSLFDSSSVTTGTVPRTESHNRMAAKSPDRCRPVKAACGHGNIDANDPLQTFASARCNASTDVPSELSGRGVQPCRLIEIDAEHR